MAKDGSKLVTLENFIQMECLKLLVNFSIKKPSPNNIPTEKFQFLDRKKDLVKLQAGEYVSLGKVESALKSLTVIDEICAYAESSKNFVVALIVPNPKQLQEIAEKEGIKDTEFADLCESPVVIKAVLKEIAEQARKANLQKFEVPTAITLSKELWTPESGLVTSSFKLKRKDIQNHFQNDINKMYAQ